MVTFDAPNARMNVSTDDYSVKVTSSEDPLFFVRLDFGNQRDGKLVFSDFRLGENVEFGLEALLAIESCGCRLENVVSFEFLNIYPGYHSDFDKDELVARHDGIVEVVGKFCSLKERILSKVRLVPRQGKFDTVVLIE